MNAPSIRKRLLAWLLLPAVLILTAGTLSDYFTALPPYRDAYDQAMFDAALAISAHANGITFNITYTAAVQNNANFSNIQNAVNYVKSEFIALYADPVTLNFTIDAGAIGLGESLFSNNYWSGSYAQLRAALVADKKSADDATATAAADLPAADIRPRAGKAPASEYADCNKDCPQ